MSLTPDRAYITSTLQQLVRINSINPDLVPGSPGEAQIGEYVAGAMTALGLSVTRHEPEPGRISVVGKLPGSGGGRSLMLNAHYDTVDVQGMAAPFSADIQGGKLYGRGAYDMKGSLAAQMGAVKALTDADITLQGDLLIAAVADEEYASIGTADLIARYPVDGAIVTEPTELDICLAHKGFLWFNVEIWGRAAHGSRFDLGLDANLRMGRVLAELDKLEQALRSQAGHSLVGPPSLHTGKLAGGTAFSVYPAHCSLQLERRTIPGETEADVHRSIQGILDRLSDQDSTFKARLTPVMHRRAFEVSLEAPVVQALTAAAAHTLGRVPAYVGQTPWMDSALLAEAGVETVVMGPVGAGAHADEEWVDVESVIDLAEVLARAAVNYCGQGKKALVTN